MEKHNLRWPVREVMALLVGVIPFTGPDVLQQTLGQLPELWQLGLIFTAAPFVLLSAGRLAAQAIHAKRKGLAIVCAICAILGGLLNIFATYVVFVLGASTSSIAFSATWFACAAMIVYAGDVWEYAKQGSKAERIEHGQNK